ncbi:porin [Burkholderia multivorans]|uniref:porin n=1 Tax=Burkholderia multivorans TaxID=87883 RepID=UPI0013E0151C|nr:porin [Burkholderia multivorans]MCO1386808.1 porin [Burkholderia multivorans]NGM80780.1 porin [Burkholderia multivorans]UQO10292.1 porin [Burkholderia multivorans]UQO57828.1 porin [Burkholderia multivorans]UQO61429.1 porin [Burkholderia multivorans]
MKNNLWIIVGCMLTSQTVLAQSSVTLFGTIDEGLNFTSNVAGSRSYQMATSELATSRWGVKGNEDLGGGLSALFDLESGFDVNSGQLYYGNRMFGYQAYVGLQSTQYGSLMLGRQYDSIVDVISPLTANGNWAGWLFSHPLDNDNTDGSYHVSNAVKFTSNTYGGLSATATYGFSNAAGAFSQNRFYSAGLSYVYNTLTVGAAFANMGQPGTTVGGAVATDDAGFAAKNQKTYALGATYGIGAATVGAVYTRVALQQPTSSIYLTSLGLNGADVDFDNFELNARYNVTPTILVGAMYVYTRAQIKRDGNDAAIHWNEIGLMGQYLLSKRTSVYLQYVYQRVSGGTTGSALDYAFVPGTAGPSSGDNVSVVRIGISHAF